MKNNFKYAVLDILATALSQSGPDAENIRRHGPYDDGQTTVKTLGAAYLAPGNPHLKLRAAGIAALTLTGIAPYKSESARQQDTIKTLIPATLRGIFLRAGLTEAGTPSADPDHKGDTDRVLNEAGKQEAVNPEPGQFVVRTGYTPGIHDGLEQAMAFFNHADQAKIEETIREERAQAEPPLPQGLFARMTSNVRSAGMTLFHS